MRSLRPSSNHASNSAIRFEGGLLLFGRVSTSVAASTQLTPPNNKTGNAVVSNKITADAFQTSSDERCKDKYEEITAEGSWDIVESVHRKKSKRFDIEEQPQRHGLVAQDLQHCCTGAFGTSVTEFEPHENQEELTDDSKMLGVGYSRLTVVLWRCCQD